MTKRARVFALVVTAMVIATATLTPGTQGLHPAASVSGRIRRFLMDAGLPCKLGPLGFEFLANIVMFIPLGLFLGVLWWRRWRGLLFAVPPLVSLSIETFQFLFLPHRGPQFEDIIANSLGGWIGLGIFLVARAAWARCLSVSPTAKADQRGGGESSREKSSGERGTSQRLSATGQATGSSSRSGCSFNTPSTWAAASIGLDTAAWGAAIVLTGLLIFNFQGGRMPWRGEGALWVVVVALQVLVGWLLQVYPPGRLPDWEETTALIIITLGAGTVTWLATLIFGANFGIPRSLMFGATPIALAGVLAARWVVSAAKTLST